MSEELGEPLSFLESIPPRDKEVILLAPIYFYSKYMRRNINIEGFEPVVPPWSDDDPLSIFRAGFSIHDQVNADVDGNAPGIISDALSNHPMRGKLFPHLEDSKIKDICRELDDMFENQEFCAECESWSYYEAKTPEEFAIEAAAMMLWLCGGNIGIGWFEKTYKYVDREAIIKAILREKTARKLNGLLSSEKFNF